jgi:hypothetical protein
MIENKEVVPAENPNSADSAPKPAEVGLTRIAFSRTNKVALSTLGNAGLMCPLVCRSKRPR